MEENRVVKECLTTAADSKNYRTKFYNLEAIIAAAIVAEARRDCYWLCIVTNCNAEPTLQEPVKDPACLDWHEVTKVAHHYLSVNAMTRPMMVGKDQSPYGKRKK